MTAARSRRPRRWLRIGLTLAAGAAGVVALNGRLPDADAVLATASHADLRWAALAVLAQLISQTMFACQQRQLLTAFAVDISPLRALAITYSRSAISMAMPAGSAVSATYAFQQYRQRGASRSIATTVSLLSGVASTAGLILLYTTGLLTSALARSAATAAAVLAVACALAVWHAKRAARLQRPRPSPRRTQTPWPAINRAIDDIASAARHARTVDIRHWAATIAYAAANWLLDLVCLIAAAHACHLTLGPGQLAGVYLAAQIVRQLPITPGGIGLIETSLLTGLVAAGATQTSAAAAVLGYRLISFWLVLPIGLASYLGLRRRNGQSRATPDLPFGSPNSGLTGSTTIPAVSRADYLPSAQ